MKLFIERYSEIVEFLSSHPQLDSEQKRRALIYGACLDEQLNIQIDFSGSNAQFIPLLVTQLLRYGQLQDGRNALEAVLMKANALIGSNRQFNCNALIQSPISIKVPFVVVAMTEAEVKELQNPNFYNHPDILPIRSTQEYTRFDELKGTVESHQKDWETSYQYDRDKWSPHICPESNITHIIESTITKINTDNMRNSIGVEGRRIVEGISYSQDFFAQDKRVREDIERQLKKSGGLFIIDAISLFHPRLRHIIEQSGLISANENVAMIVVFPLNAKEWSINPLIEQVIETHLKQISSRCDTELDRLCEIGNGNLRILKRWLYVNLPRIAGIVAENMKKHNIETFEKNSSGKTGDVSSVFGKEVYSQ